MKTGLKICLVTTAFPRWPGDFRGNFVYYAAQALSDLGASVRVIAMHAPGAKPREQMGALDVIRLRYVWPEQWEILQDDGGGLPSLWRSRPMARPLFFLWGLVEVLGVMWWARDCDIIHAQWTLSAAAAWAGRWFHRRPYLVTVHGSDIFQAAKMPVFRWVTRRALEEARCIVAVSQTLADHTASLSASPLRIEVIPNGINTRLFHPSPKDERDKLILCVGSLIERKGTRYLLEAMGQLTGALPDYRLAIVGTGPLQSELEQLAKMLGVSEHVEFIGSQTPDEISVWMRRAMIFVLPSLEEAMGVVLLEALASGTPCVASQVGGIPEVVAPGVGLLVPPRDAAALARAILSALDEAAWQSMHAQAQTYVLEKCYTWPKVAARLMSIYASALNHAA